MARAEWLAIQAELRRSGPAIALSSKLGVEPRYVVGLMLDVWTWATRATADGFVPDVSRAWFDREFGHAGLADALASPAVKWLEIDPDGQHGLRFPRWERWLSKGSKARIQAAERQGRQRRRKRPDQLTPPLELRPATPLPSRSQRDNGHAPSVTKVTRKA